MQATIPVMKSCSPLFPTSCSQITKYYRKYLEAFDDFLVLFFVQTVRKIQIFQAEIGFKHKTELFSCLASNEVVTDVERCHIFAVIYNLFEKSLKTIFFQCILIDKEFLKQRHMFKFLSNTQNSSIFHSISSN